MAGKTPCYAPDIFVLFLEIGERPCYAPNNFSLTFCKVASSTPQWAK